MNLTHTCLECLYAQIYNFLHILQPPQSDKIRDEILTQTKAIIDSLGDSIRSGDSAESNAQSSGDTHTSCVHHAYPPPKAAIAVYDVLAKILGNPDPYKAIKTHSIESAAKILASATHTYTDTISDGVKIAALGNVIDYGSQSRFSFESDFSFAHLAFAHFDIEAFEQALGNAKNLLYIADNAGENLFDTILLKNIKKHYPQIQSTYLVRGAPIINDLTLSDVAHPLCEELHTLCDVRSSHMRSPGFIYADAPIEMRTMFDNADVIVAKGMGNYECLESLKRNNLFLLFKVKCSVVAEYSGFELGKMVFLHNKGE